MALHISNAGLRRFARCLWCDRWEDVPHSNLSAGARVPGGGLEPPRDCSRRILSPVRLPVPPSRPIPPKGISGVEANVCGLYPKVPFGLPQRVQTPITPHWLPGLRNSVGTVATPL